MNLLWYAVYNVHLSVLASTSHDNFKYRFNCSHSFVKLLVTILHTLSDVHLPDRAITSASALVRLDVYYTAAPGYRLMSQSA